MKKILSHAYLLLALVLPQAYALAHGGVDDGHVEGAVETVDPSGRKYVMIAVAVVFALIVAWFVYARMKDAPVAPPNTPEPAPGNDANIPPATPPQI